MDITDIPNSSKYTDVVSKINDQKTTANTQSSANTTNDSVMEKDDFLKLLMTTLTNQDPTNPTDTSEMMQQMAMLGLMEQTTNMRTAVEELTKSTELSKWQEVSNLVGKTVDAVNSKGEEVEGKVKEIFNYDGTMYLLTDDDVLQVNQIVSLRNDSQNSTTTEDTKKTVVSDVIPQNTMNEAETASQNDEYTVGDLSSLGSTTK